jgi:hypothetical protein
MMSEFRPEVEGFFPEWCEEQDWPHKRQAKVLRERLLGPYEVDQLRFQAVAREYKAAKTRA